MRYLKKFENNNNELDVEYIKDCFVEFLDNGAEVEVDELEDGRPYIEFVINLPGIKYKNEKWKRKYKLGGKFNIEDKINYYNILVEHYKNIELCIEKAKINNENIIVEINNETELDGKQEFEAYTFINFTLPKKRMNLEKNKLNIVKYSDLNDTWI